MNLRNSTLKLLFIALLLACNDNKGLKEGSEKHLKSVEQNQSVEPFAENIFSQFTNVRDLTMNSDENEAYFTLQSPGRELSVIMKIIKQNNVWQEPEISSFSGKYSDLEPFLSPDNLKLYFVSNRPISNDSTSTKDMDIWFVERTALTEAWSEPKNIGSPINTDKDEFYPSVASNGNLYFTTIEKELESADDIFMSKWENGNYSDPIVLGDFVNTKGAEYNAYISPDESYLIFGAWRRPDGIGSGDMYISKNINDTWTKAINLGDRINSPYMEFCPFVVNETLYFTSRRSDVASGENGFTSTDALFTELNKYSNGLSRIYKVSFNSKEEL